MKIVLSMTEPSLDAEIDPRFGRCVWLMVVESESGEIVESQRNEFAAAAGGAGSQTAQRVAELGGEAVLTGNVGPNAFSVLGAARIPVYTGVSGTARQAIEALKQGKLQPTGAATAARHSGMN